MKPVYRFLKVTMPDAGQLLLRAHDTFGVGETHLTTQVMCTLGTLEAGAARRHRGRSTTYLATVANVPHLGATLVAESAGVGVVVAMAVLVLRSLHLLQTNVLDVHEEPHIVRGSRLDEVRRRLRAVCDLDAPTWRARPLPTAVAPWSDQTDIDVAALEESCEGPYGGGDMSLLVATAATWVLWGPDGVTEADQETLSLIFDACDATTVGVDVRPSVADAVAHFQCCIYRALEDRMDVIRWIEAGKVPTLVTSTAALHGDAAMFVVHRQRDRDPLEIVLHDGGQADQLCVVETAHKGAVEVGLRVAPVVIHAPPTEPSMARNYTIAAWSAAHVDLDGAHRDIVAIEDGWTMTLTQSGGHLAAPTGGSHLGLGVVVETVSKHMAKQA